MNQKSCSSGTLSANNRTRVRTGGVDSTLNQYEALNPTTPLSINSTSSNTKTETEQHNNQTGSLFDQLKNLPSIHEDLVIDETESSLSEPQKKKPRIEE